MRVNMGKTKVMLSGLNLNTLKDSGKFHVEFADPEATIYIALAVHTGCIRGAVESAVK